MIRRTTQMATVVLSNHKFPKDGQVSIPLPIPPEEYDHYILLSHINMSPKL